MGSNYCFTRIGFAAKTTRMGSARNNYICSAGYTAVRGMKFTRDTPFCASNRSGRVRDVCIGWYNNRNFSRKKNSRIDRGRGGVVRN